MNRIEKLRLLKNSAANLLRGAGAALMTLVLLPFLTRYLSPGAFGSWAIVLQVSAYVGYLDFGMQTAIGRFVAHAGERKDFAYRNRVASSALMWLSLAAALAFVLSVAASALLPLLFRQMPAAFLGQSRIALLLVASSLCIGLPASVFSGIFVGLQRSAIPAFIISGCKLAACIAMAVAVVKGYSILMLAAITATTNLMASGLLYVAFHNARTGINLRYRDSSRALLRELASFCKSLAIWSFAMLLVNGLDLLIVGVFRFEETAYYAVAAGLITFLGGMLNALFTAMIPSTAVIHARNDAAALSELVVSSTRYCALFLLVTGLPLIILARPLLALWAGGAYAEHGTVILRVLVLANMIRLSATPYIVTLIGTGEQKLVTISPLLEGGSNLVASLLLGYFFGAIGVAFGTLLGAFVGIGGNLLYNMPRTSSISLSVPRYLKDGLFRPVLCFLPMILLYLLQRFLYSMELLIVLSIVTLVTSLIIALRWGGVVFPALFPRRRNEMATGR